MSESRELKFTKTQTKLLEVLSDGEPHTKEELRSCCHHQSLPSVVNNHVSILRKLLILRGETIVCEYTNGQYKFRHIRLLNPK